MDFYFPGWQFNRILICERAVNYRMLAGSVKASNRDILTLKRFENSNLLQVQYILTEEVQASPKPLRVMYRALIIILLSPKQTIHLLLARMWLPGNDLMIMAQAPLKMTEGWTDSRVFITWIT